MHILPWVIPFLLNTVMGAILITNPMKWDGHQRWSAGIAVFALIYFASHTLQRSKISDRTATAQTLSQTGLDAATDVGIQKRNSNQPTANNINSNNPITISNNSGNVSLNSPGATQVINLPRKFISEYHVERFTREGRHVLKVTLSQTQGYWNQGAPFRLKAQFDGPYNQAGITFGLSGVRTDELEVAEKAKGYYSYSTSTAPHPGNVVLEVVSDNAINIVALAVEPT